MSQKGSQLKQTLGFWDLVGAAVGQIIGAGIMSLTGIAIGLTGRSVPIAFLLASVMVLITYMPVALLNTVGRYQGGQYTIIGTMLSDKFTGVYSILFVLRNLSLSLYCLSFADYALPFLPMVPRKLLAIGILVVVYGLNILGIDKFSKFQKIIVVTLALALSVFSAYGIANMDFDSYYSPDTFLTGGLLGLLTAAAQLTFATGGADIIANLSAEAKNPTRDIPKAMIVSTVGVAILYAFMSVTAAGILPVEQVANEPLTHVAQAILPKPLYVFFIIGGAWFALISTLNSQLATCTKPLIQAAKDGWFPEKLGYIHEKYRTPIYLLTFFFLVGLTPILLNINISVISKSVTFVGTFINTIIVLSFHQMTKKYKALWEDSPLHIKDGTAKLLTVSSIIIFIFQAYLMGRALPVKMLLANVAVIVIAFVYATVRYNSGKVKINVSFESNEVKSKA